MNKRKLHHAWTKFRGVSYWYFLAGFLIFGFISLYSLRQNNLQMIHLRDAVTQADKDNGDVETALRNLREYVYRHMNTNLSSGNNIKPPIQLKYRYDRLVAAEQAKNAQANTQVYTDAQHYCEQLYPGSFSGGPRVPCITNYVSSHPVAGAAAIPDSLYKFDFVSPSWSPDLAGWSLVVSLIFLVLFIVRFGLERWVRAELHDHA